MDRMARCIAARLCMVTRPVVRPCICPGEIGVSSPQRWRCMTMLCSCSGNNSLTRSYAHQTMSSAAIPSTPHKVLNQINEGAKEEEQTCVDGSAGLKQGGMKMVPTSWVEDLESLQRMTTTEEILEHSKFETKADALAMAVGRLGQIVSNNRELASKVIHDNRLHTMLTFLSSKLENVGHSNLVGLQWSIWQLWRGQPPGERGPPKEFVKSLHGVLSNKLKKLSYKNLSFLAEALALEHGHSGRQGQQSEGFELENDLMSKTLRMLELRWVEADNGVRVALLMARAGPLSPLLMERLEEKALELIESMPLWAMRTICIALANQKRSPQALLRAIAYYLAQERSTICPKLVIDIVNAFVQLRFFNYPALKQMAKSIVISGPQLNSWQVSEASLCFSRLKFYSPALYRTFAQHLTEHVETMEVTYLAELIMAFARVNFLPANDDDVFPKVFKRLEAEFDHLKLSTQLMVVWCLCVLGLPQPNLLAQVLSSSFYLKMVDEYGDFVSKLQSLTCKLMHINTCARLECPEYQGPFISKDIVKPLELKEQSPLRNNMARKERTSMHPLLVQAVSSSFGGDESLFRTSLSTTLCWWIDAEILLNSNGTPMPLHEFEAPHLLDNIGLRPLPLGARRVVFLACDFTHFLLQSQDQHGLSVLKQRQLRQAGFVVVPVPYFDFEALTTNTQRAAFIMKKMTKILAEDRVT
uniref:FAST kinase domain-containing protein 4-like isoform X2 n=1 Tax=Myxine glutinosa TaxID=7769 RepID=UPI00358F1080